MNEEYKTMQRDELERPVDKHIYIKNRLVLEELKAAENASKYIEKAILYYREQMKSEYATVKDLEGVRRDIQILNQNYIASKEVLEEVAKYMRSRGGEYEVF